MANLSENPFEPPQCLAPLEHRDLEASEIDWSNLKSLLENGLRTERSLRSSQLSLCLTGGLFLGSMAVNPWPMTSAMLAFFVFLAAVLIWPATDQTRRWGSWIAVILLIIFPFASVIGAHLWSIVRNPWTSLIQTPTYLEARKMAQNRVPRWDWGQILFQLIAFNGAWVCILTMLRAL